MPVTIEIPQLRQPEPLSPTASTQEIRKRLSEDSIHTNGLESLLTGLRVAADSCRINEVLERMVRYQGHIDEIGREIRSRYSKADKRSELFGALFLLEHRAIQDIAEILQSKCGCPPPSLLRAPATPEIPTPTETPTPAPARRRTRRTAATTES